jgi:peroxin-19
VLDDFTATRIDTAPIPSASGPGRPTEAISKAPELEAPIGDDEFAAELQKGMADLLGELESSPEMQKQFEDMIRELGKGQEGEEGALPGLPGLPPLPGLAGLPGLGAERSVGSASASEAAKGEASFQETIRKTMERMQESGEAAGAAATTAANSEDDFMAALLKEMEGGGSEEDFSKMLLGMMEQLTNKEILYEPMKELDNKFPDWMKNNGDKTPEADMKRYREQQRLVREIVARFELPGYSDEDVPSREYILERMQKVSSHSKTCLS